MIKRLTDRKHIPSIIALGKKFHAKSPMAQLPFDSRRSAETFECGMADPFQAVFAAYDGHRLCGVLLGAVCDYPFFRATYATDRVFIAEKHGARLYHAFRKWGLSRGVSAFQMGVTSGDGLANKFYEAVGMQPIGGLFFRQVEVVQTKTPDFEVPNWEEAAPCQG